MITNIAYYQILGLPLILYLGVLTILSLFATAVNGYLAMKGKIDFKWHHRFAAITLLLAATHGTIGLLAYV